MANLNGSPRQQIQVSLATPIARIWWKGGELKKRNGNNFRGNKKVGETTRKVRD
jgi:hypothetical protein